MATKKIIDNNTILHACVYIIIFAITTREVFSGIKYNTVTRKKVKNILIKRNSFLLSLVVQNILVKLSIFKITKYIVNTGN